MLQLILAAAIITGYCFFQRLEKELRIKTDLLKVLPSNNQVAWCLRQRIAPGKPDLIFYVLNTGEMKPGNKRHLDKGFSILIDQIIKIYRTAYIGFGG